APSRSPKAAGATTVTGPLGRSGGPVRLQGAEPPDLRGTLVPLLLVAGSMGGLETALAPLPLPLPPPLATESLRTSCYNPHKDPRPRGAAAQCNRVLSSMGDHDG